MQQRFGTNTDVIQLLDAGPDGAWILLQVLDASVLFFDGSKETLLSGGTGLIAPNATQGFQLKAQANQAPFFTWWTGVMFGRSDTVGGTINAAIVYKPKKCGCGGNANAGINTSAPLQPQIQDS